MLHTTKRKTKNKIYHDYRCQQICKKLNRYSKEKSTIFYKTNGPHRLTLHAPTRLNIFDATEEALKFFAEVSSAILKCGVHSFLYFDLSQVESITPDAIMYLIAIIKNTKRIRTLGITCQGNMPINKDARALFQEVGFYKFVSSSCRYNVAENKKYMKIQNGILADSVLAGNFCDFTNTNNGETFIYTKSLYTMIVELMTNTHQHAYQDNSENKIKWAMYYNWYIYAQNVEGEIQFIFLDTGIGIPNTVSKRRREKLKDSFGRVKESVYLQSALTGDYARTETGLPHRGKGLPGIYEDCKKGAIQNLKIISGQAKCVVGPDGSVISEDMASSFRGTLFTWKLTNKGGNYDCN